MEQFQSELTTALEPALAELEASPNGNGQPDAPETTDAPPGGDDFGFGGGFGDAPPAGGGGPGPGGMPPGFGGGAMGMPMGGMPTIEPEPMVVRRIEGEWKIAVSTADAAEQPSAEEMVAGLQLANNLINVVYDIIDQTPAATLKDPQALQGIVMSQVMPVVMQGMMNMPGDGGMQQPPAGEGGFDDFFGEGFDDAPTDGGDEDGMPDNEPTDDGDETAPPPDEDFFGF